MANNYTEVNILWNSLFSPDLSIAKHYSPVTAVVTRGKKINKCQGHAVSNPP